MKRYGHLYEKVYDLDNLKLAHKNARKGKGWYEEVCMVDRHPEKYLGQLQDQLKLEIEGYLMQTRSLAIKENWQVFPVAARGIDFLGYRIFPGFTLLRKSTLKRMKFKVRQVNKHLETYPLLTHNQWCSLNSYHGWLIHCDSFRLRQKYMVPLEPAITKFYEEVIVNESQRNATRSKVS